MSEEAFKFIEEHGKYYLTDEEMYIRMFGCSREPSLPHQYATDYVVHKEAVRQVYLDGVKSFLFEHKKAAYLSIPFWIGNYKFTNIKRAAEFVEEMEQFHFGEMSFHMNDSQKKVV